MQAKFPYKYLGKQTLSQDGWTSLPSAKLLSNKIVLTSYFVMTLTLFVIEATAELTINFDPTKISGTHFQIMIFLKISPFRKNDVKSPPRKKKEINK